MSLIQSGIAVLILRIRRSALSLTGFAIQLLGGIIGALTLPDWNFNYLLQRDAVRN
jgi:hypothetical protein